MLMLQSAGPNYDFFDVFMYERAGDVLLDPLGTALAVTLVVVIGLAVANSRLPRSLKNLVYAALALRVVGAAVRYAVLFGVYRGSGDARRYYSRGLEDAASYWALDFSPLLDSSGWWGTKWWGAQFVVFSSSSVLSFLGPSMPGAFLVFSLLAFLGLSGFVLAFRRAYPDVAAVRYARWIWLFPALWYWPSSIGKEAIVLMGLGLAIAGYVGRNGRINWILLFGGMFFVFAIRPQVAAVVIFSLVIAHWLSLMQGRWTLGRVVQGAVLFGAGMAGIWLAMQKIGVGGFDVEGVQGYMEDKTGRGAGGGSAIDEVGVGLGGVPLALVNILVRPFLWEARSLMVLITSLEITLFWVIAWYRRDALLRSLRYWHTDRLLRVAIPFIVVYSLTLGMVIANLGIITRQRIFLFPFLFLLLEAAPRGARRAPAAPGGVASPSGPPRQRPVPATAGGTA
jgi:hypothetical protein